MSFLKAMEEIESNIKNNLNVNENDYLSEDGLLICGNCHTKKQTRVEFLGFVKTPYCLCKCEIEKVEAEERRKKEAEQAEKIAIIRRFAFPDATAKGITADDMKAISFKNDNQNRPDLTKVAKNYVENFPAFYEKGKGLLFFGTVGTGKSYMAACIANALIDRGYEVLMTSISRIADTAFNYKGNKQEYYDKLNSYKLLILDDLGVERNTDYMNEIVYKVIDGRYKANMPMIVTSNLTGAELRHADGINNQRTYSRILEMCYPVRVDGEDQRRKKSVEDFAETKRLLGL